MATYYVDPVSGNNANGGTSVGDAWETIAYAFTQTFSTYDILLLLNTGTHTVSSSLTTLGEVYIRGANSSGTVDGSMATIDFTGTGGLFTNTVSSTVYLKYLEIYRSTGTRSEYVVTQSATANIYSYFENCKIHNFDYGFYNNASYSGTMSGFMYDCEFYDFNEVIRGSSNRSYPDFHYCNIHDIYSIFHRYTRVPILNHCVFWNMSNGDDYLIDTPYGSGSLTFCTLYGVGYRIGDRSTSDVPVGIYGNAFINAPQYAILWDSSNLSYPHMLDYNLYYNSTSGNFGNMPSFVSMGPNSITGQDPLLVDPANGDLTPSPTSPLIGAGPGGLSIGALQPNTVKKISVG